MTDFKAEDNTGTIPVQTRHQIPISNLTEFMAANVEGFKGPITLEEFAGGQSNPTYLITTDDRRYVLRRKPPGELLKSAHAVDREYNGCGTDYTLFAKSDGEVKFEVKGPHKRRFVSVVASA